jgi:hypothetical protein
VLSIAANKYGTCQKRVTKEEIQKLSSRHSPEKNRHKIKRKHWLMSIVQVLFIEVHDELRTHIARAIAQTYIMNES